MKSSKNNNKNTKAVRIDKKGGIGNLISRKLGRH